MTGEILPRLRLTYDTQLDPLSYDFVVTLAICRALCHLNKLQPQFDVAIVSRGFRNVGIEGSYSDEYRERKLRDVLVSTALNCKWVNSLTLVRGDTPVPPHHGPEIPTQQALALVGKVPQWQITPCVNKQLETVLNSGGAIPDVGFQASTRISNRYKDALKNAVVVHPRVSNYNTARNTNKSMIGDVGRRLRELGFQTYFVPDIDDLRTGFSWSDSDWTPLPNAGFDLEERIAAAETAAANLIFSGGGNCNPLHFSKSRFFWTGFVDDSERVTSVAFMREKASTVGKNPIWLDPRSQWYDWTPRPEITPQYMVDKLVALINLTRNRV